MNAFNQYLEQRRAEIDASISGIVEAYQWDLPSLKECVSYSLFGGKRLRGIVLIEACQSCGCSFDIALPFAAGIEMIHAYSLVHDDLPCMDNDDYRRGQLTCHRKFGEAMAVLCGDALLTMAFEIMLSSTGARKDLVCRAVQEIASGSGPKGMVGGQVLDLELERKTPDPNQIMKMYSMKTGALFEVAARTGAIVGGAPDNLIDALGGWGRSFGYAYQIIDDISDIGESQKEEDKSTLVKALSFEEARKEAERALSDSICCLSVPGLDERFFVNLTELYINKLGGLYAP